MTRNTQQLVNWVAGGKEMEMGGWKDGGARDGEYFKAYLLSTEKVDFAPSQPVARREESGKQNCSSMSS